MDLHSTHIPCDTHINFEQLRIKLENEDTVCEVVENVSEIISLVFFLNLTIFLFNLLNLSN